MRMHAALLFVGLTSLAFAAAATETPFQKAFTEAGRYAIQFDDPASVQTGINLYYSVIETFSNDPEVYKAQLAVFDILRSEGSERSLSQASDIIKAVLGQADLSSSAGQTIALAFADFHLEEARGCSFQNIEDTKRVLERLQAQAIGQKHSLLLLRVASREANVRTQEGEAVASLKRSIAMLKEANTWGTEEGFWSTLFAADAPQYQRYMQELNRIESSACWAIEQSDDLEISVLLRHEPVILTQYEHLRKTWKDFELQHIVGSREEIDRIQDQLLDSLILSTELPTGTPPGLGRGSVRTDVSRESQPQEEPKPEVVEAAQETASARSQPGFGVSKTSRLIAGIVSLIILAFLGVRILKWSGRVPV
jgi:hypothetical protein